MDVTPGGMLSDLLGDGEVAALFGDEAMLEAMLEFEAALARTEAALGIIPAGAAAAITGAAAAIEPDTTAIRSSVAVNGVPVIELVAQLRRAAGDPHGESVHFGATSQDVIDSAWARQAGKALDLLRARLVALCDALAGLAADHRDTVMAGRTRGQQAVPTSFGCRVVNWLEPLVRHLQRLDQLEPRVLRLAFGGAAGNLSVFGDRGPELAQALAEEYGLDPASSPWHVQRDAVVEAGHWLSTLTQSLAKTADDLWLMALNEVAEVAFRGRAGSSTMPQKNNPVLAESVGSLAAFSAGLEASLTGAARAGFERGGEAWQVEWLVMPRLFESAGAALNDALKMIDALDVRAEAMLDNLEASRGLALAEAFTFELARHLPRSRAKERVAEAVTVCLRDGVALADVLAAATTDLGLDWPELARYENHLGASGRIVDGALARWKAYRDGVED